MKYTIFPLGNPGSEYEYTRHNAARIAFRNANLEDTGAELVTPDCYMNESGRFVKSYLKYRNNCIPVIVYDDIDLPLAKIKISFGRSAGGHNGVQNVIDELGTEDFVRIRIGIGGKPHKEMLLQDYVISKLSKEEVEILKALGKSLSDIVATIEKSGVDKAMEKYN